jgi:hypothetical protein
MCECPTAPDKLGPRVGEDEVLDTLLRAVEDRGTEYLWDPTPILRTVIDG